MKNKQANLVKNFESNLITILEIGEKIVSCLALDQIDQAISLVDNRDRLINIYKELSQKRTINQKEAKAINAILKQDESIVQLLEKAKNNAIKSAGTLQGNKSKIDSYRQTTSV